MIELRHVGIYVEDMEKMTLFYENTFQMERICYNQLDSNILLDELLGTAAATISTTKLITPRGKMCGVGDMIELIKIIDNEPKRKDIHSVFDEGIMHLALGVDDINDICQKVIQNGGKLYTNICKHMNGNQFVFVNDPEGNWIELIQRKKLMM